MTATIAPPIAPATSAWPLPGAPGYSGYGMQAIIDNALRDTEALAEGGVDGLIVGSSIKQDGRCENPVDLERVRRLVAAAHGDH